MQEAPQPEARLTRFLRKTELTQYVGLRRSQIDQMIKTGEFPRPVRLTDTGTAVAWLESEVAAWQLRRLAKREADNGGAVATGERGRV